MESKRSTTATWQIWLTLHFPTSFNRSSFIFFSLGRSPNTSSLSFFLSLQPLQHIKTLNNVLTSTGVKWANFQNINKPLPLKHYLTNKFSLKKVNILKEITHICHRYEYSIFYYMYCIFEYYDKITKSLKSKKADGNGSSLPYRVISLMWLYFLLYAICSSWTLVMHCLSSSRFCFCFSSRSLLFSSTCLIFSPLSATLYTKQPTSNFYP